MAVDGLILDVVDNQITILLGINGAGKTAGIQFRKNNKKIDIKKIGSTLNNDDKNINFHHLIEREYAELLQMAKDAAKKAGFEFV